MTDFVAICEDHLRRLTTAVPDIAGDMWPSVLDVRTGRYPEDTHAPRRVYRLIGAPRGSTLYWDQPILTAAYRLSDLTGDRRYARSADRYVKAFLDHCVAPDGMFRWGNHAYYDVFERRTVEFHGGHHELRPITPAWDFFWKHTPEGTDRYIRTMLRRHLYDPEGGGFNRHDNAKQGHAFLEAGGILCESAAWLYGRTGDRELLETALSIARYSHGRRDPATGLTPNEPDAGRWDARVCTSEIGLWAGCLLRAGLYTDDPGFAAMAGDAVRAFLAHAYDPATGKFYGQVAIDNGAPVVPQTPGYWPRQYSDPWNTDQWPTHDYPMHLAEACLDLYGRTGEDVFKEGVRRLACAALGSRPGQNGREWAYAESYGRCIGFLVRAGRELPAESFGNDAMQLANEAVERLCENGMIKGFPDGAVYESVDGVGCLMTAFLLVKSNSSCSRSKAGGYLNCCHKPQIGLRAKP